MRLAVVAPIAFAVGVGSMMVATDSRAAITVGDPQAFIVSGGPPDSPANRVDPNVPASPFNGVVSINIRYIDEDPTSDTFGQRLSFICSGAMITSRHVLSAAHCVDTLGNGTVIDITKPGNDVRVVEISDTPRRAQVLFRAYRVEPAIGSPAERRQHQVSISLQLLEGPQGNGQIEVENGVSKEDLIGVAAEHLGHAVAIDPRDGEHSLVAENALLLLSHLADGPSLQRVLQMDTVHNGGRLGGARHLLDLPVDVGTVTDLKVDVHSAEADGIHLSVELGDQLPGPLCFAVGSKAPHMHLFAEHLSGELIVTGRRSQADADNLFGHGRPLDFYCTWQMITGCNTARGYYTRFPWAVKEVSYRIETLTTPTQQFSL